MTKQKNKKQIIINNGSYKTPPRNKLNKEAKAGYYKKIQ